MASVMPDIGTGTDAGDKPWEGPLPADALTDMELAKGTIHRMTDQAWWCAEPSGAHHMPAACALVTYCMQHGAHGPKHAGACGAPAWLCKPRACLLQQGGRSLHSAPRWTRHCAAQQQHQRSRGIVRSVQGLAGGQGRLGLAESSPCQPEGPGRRQRPQEGPSPGQPARARPQGLPLRPLPACAPFAPARITLLLLLGLALQP